MPNTMATGIMGLHVSVVNSRKWESLDWPHQEEVGEELNLLIEEIFQTILYP